jgi:hypothetical protein
MTIVEYRSCLAECEHEGLIARESISRNTGGPYPITDDILKIAPGMNAVLLELLYPPAS